MIIDLHFNKILFKVFKDNIYKTKFLKCSKFIKYKI